MTSNEVARAVVRSPEAHHVTGEVCFVLKVLARSMRYLEQNTGRPDRAALLDRFNRSNSDTNIARATRRASRRLRPLLAINTLLILQVCCDKC